MKNIYFILKNIFAMLALISMILIAIFKIYLPIKTNNGEVITVPNLIGMNINDLNTFLEDRNLRYEILEDSSYSSDKLPFTVLYQNPSEGNKVKKNRKIYLTLNSVIPPKIKIPNIINGSVKNAQLILKSYDLKLGNIKYIPDLAMNAVLKMYVNGDSVSINDLVDKGTIIDLEVGDGLGNQTFFSPDLIGLSFEEAEFTIIGSGLRLGNVNYQDSAYIYLKSTDIIENLNNKVRIQPGNVFKQFPESNIKVKIGRKIDLWVVRDTINGIY